jgi:hypothetical protein
VMIRCMVSPLFPFSSGRPECERSEVALVRSSALAVRMPGAGGRQQNIRLARPQAG